MLQIKSVRKTFNETVILQEISLLCERGKIYGIMGRIREICSVQVYMWIS